MIQIQIRRGTAEQWTAANPVLALGEIGIETDTDKFKIGNGQDPWEDRPYGGLEGPQGETGPSGPTGPTGPTASDPVTVTDNHTIVAADVGTVLLVENAADREVTLGDLSVGDWPIGETLAIVRAGTGEVDLLASGAVVLKSTLGSGEDVRIPDEWGLIVVYRKAENDYLVSGAVAEVPE